MTFYIVFLKQTGLTINEIFIIHTVAPIVQFLGTACLAFLTDKIGKAKAILMLNLILTGLSLVMIMHVPNVTVSKCTNDSVLFLHQGDRTWTTNQTSICNAKETKLYFEHCKEICAKGTELILAECEANASFSATMKSFPILNEVCSVSFTFCVNPTEQCSEDIRNNSFYLSCLQPTHEECSLTISERAMRVIAYGTVIIIFMTTYSNTYRFFDVTTAYLVTEHNADYGRIRFWGILGALTGPFIAGLTVKLSESFDRQVYYAASFYSYAILCLLTAGVVFRMDVRKFEAGTKMLKKSVELAKSPDASIFFLVVFLLGTSWGCHHMYKNWLLEEIQTSVLLFSVVDSMKGIYGLPFLFISKWIVRKVGETQIFLLAFLAHAISFYGYSFLQATWPAILLELATIVNYQLLWVAVMSFCVAITPKGLVATVNTTAGSIHFTIGRMTGGFLGGLLISNFDTRTAYRVMAIANTAFAVLYGVFLCCKRRFSKEN
ncbi:hypothetical protein AVEN_199032-1 [Araneus ventricosus]|nr:hypothetical protein AVEN_199032-1 [Araneus ventricosus]